MRKVIPLLTIVLMLALAGCQTGGEQEAEASDAAEACVTSLAVIVEGQVIMDITGAEVTAVDETPIGSGSDAQAIILNEDNFYVVRYDTVEDAAGVVFAIASAGVLSGGQVQEDAPSTTYGDEQLQLLFEDGQKTGTLIRYGDRVTLARAFNEGAVDGINEGFDSALREYIKENPACAYLHPETRE